MSGVRVLVGTRKRALVLPPRALLRGGRSGRTPTTTVGSRDGVASGAVTSGAVTFFVIGAMAGG